MIIEKQIKADVARANLFDPIVIAEDDTDSHVLITQLMFNGEVLDIPSSGYTVKLHYKLANGDKGSVSGSVFSGKVRVELPRAILELDDLVQCDICVSRTVQVTTHSLSVVSGEIVATPSSGSYDSPLRSAMFYIDSQLRVIIS